MAEVKKTTNTNKEEMVKIKLPREKNDPTVFVSVNEKTYMIQRGIEVEVPASVAEVLEHQEQMLEEAYSFDMGKRK